MHITLRQLQIFRAVALSGSTTAAADSVALSQSATSGALNELERALGTRLFDRVGKRLILNDSGRGLLPMALAVLDGAKNIEAAQISGDYAGHADLQLFASTTIGNYVLPRMLARFREEVPFSRVQLRIGNTLDVSVDNIDGDSGIFLQAVEDFKPTASTVATHGIGGVSNTLELIEDKTGNNERAHDKTSLADIGNTSIDNRTGIKEYLHLRFGWWCRHFFLRLTLLTAFAVTFPFLIFYAVYLNYWPLAKQK